nr:TPA_asm: polymerase PB2 [Cotesiavirus orthomyxi]
MNEDKKTILMRLVRQINSASKETIDILRENPMSNTKMIERSSKCLKDPNPLASMMSTINTKYPITVSRAGLTKYPFLGEYVCPDERRKEDVHQHGRVLCRKEAVDKWIEVAESPNESLIGVINILYKQPRKDVDDYYNIDWGKSRIQFGQVNLERKAVNTRAPEVYIPRQDRKELIKQELFPDYCIMYREYSTYLRSSLKEVVNSSLPDKMTLGSQIRVLLNAMDERRRILPLQPGMSEQLACFAYSMRHSNMTLKNLALKEKGGSLDYTNVVDQIGKATLFEWRTRVWTEADCIDLKRTLQIADRKLSEIIVGGQYKSTLGTQWMRVFYNMRISVETEKNGLKTSPYPSSMIVNRVYNLSGCSINSYDSPEKVAFCFGDIRGFFHHCSNELTELTCNFTTRQEFLSMTVEISKYIRYNFRDTKSKTIGRAMGEIEDLVRKEPWKVYNMSRLGLIHLLRQGLGSNSRLTLKDSVEYLPAPPTDYLIDQEGNLKNIITRQVFQVPNDEPKILASEVDCAGLMIVRHLSFKKQVKKLHQHYMTVFPQILTFIKMERWNYLNENIKKFNRVDAMYLSFQLRIMLQELANAKIPERCLICFFYIFAGTECSNPEMVVKRSMYNFSGFQLDLRGETGIFTYQGPKASYSLFGEIVGIGTNPINVSYLNFILNGYKIIETDDELPVRTVAYLQKEKDSIRNGSGFTTYISGEKVKVRRDLSANLAYSVTNQRQINLIKSWLLEGDSVRIITRKRQAEDDEELDGASLAKRERWDDYEKIYDDSEFLEQYNEEF